MRVFEPTEHQLKVLELEEWIAEVNATCLNQPVLTASQRAEVHQAKLGDRAQAYVDSIIGKLSKVDLPGFGARYDMNQIDISPWQGPFDWDDLTGSEWWTRTFAHKKISLKDAAA